MRRERTARRHRAIGRCRCRRWRPAPPTTSTASAAARIRSAGRNGGAANKAATTSARGYRPSYRARQQPGRPRRSYQGGTRLPKFGATGHRVRTLPVRVSNALPPFFLGVASGSAIAEPSASLRLGPAGLCCAIVQTFFCMVSVLLWPFSSCWWICGGIPHFVPLVSTYLIILLSAWAKFSISLQASSGEAWRSLAALIILPRFSASSRNGMKPFMQASEAPPPGIVGEAGPVAKPPPIIGDAPPVGNEPEAPPLTGGNAGSFRMAVCPETGGNAGSFFVPA